MYWHKKWPFLFSAAKWVSGTWKGDISGRHSIYLDTFSINFSYCDDYKLKKVTGLMQSYYSSKYQDHWASNYLKLYCSWYSIINFFFMQSTEAG